VIDYFQSHLVNKSTENWQQNQHIDRFAPNSSCRPDSTIAPFSITKSIPLFRTVANRWANKKHRSTFHNPF
jgi:hypothetical protein